MWIFESPVGVFKIKCSDGIHYELWINDDECPGVFSSFDLATDNVSCFSTGFNDWDCLFQASSLQNKIFEWTYIDKHS